MGESASQGAERVHQAPPLSLPAQAVIGLAVLAVRAVLILVGLVVSLPRLDVSVLPSSAVRLDPGYRAFVSMLLADHQYTNPTLLVAADAFTNVLVDARRHRATVIVERLQRLAAASRRRRASDISRRQRLRAESLPVRRSLRGAVQNRRGQTGDLAVLRESSERSLASLATSPVAHSPQPVKAARPRHRRAGTFSAVSAAEVLGTLGPTSLRRNASEIRSSQAGVDEDEVMRPVIHRRSLRQLLRLQAPGAEMEAQLLTTPSTLASDTAPQQRWRRAMSFTRRRVTMPQSPPPSPPLHRPPPPPPADIELTAAQAAEASAAAAAAELATSAVVDSGVSDAAPSTMGPAGVMATPFHGARSACVPRPCHVRVPSDGAGLGRLRPRPRTTGTRGLRTELRALEQRYKMQARRVHWAKLRSLYQEHRVRLLDEAGLPRGLDWGRTAGEELIESRRKAAAARRLRNRLWLALLLKGNPQLRPYRKHALEASIVGQNPPVGPAPAESLPGSTASAATEPRAQPARAPSATSWTRQPTTVIEDRV